VRRKKLQRARIILGMNIVNMIILEEVPFHNLFSAMSQSSSCSSSSFVLVGWGSRWFARMEEGCIEKASGGSLPRTSRETAEDEGRGRGGLGHDAKHIPDWRPPCRIGAPLVREVR
jgi:hypothetical protein